jgi:hypothetical protein
MAPSLTSLQFLTRVNHYHFSERAPNVRWLCPFSPASRTPAERWAVANDPTRRPKPPPTDTGLLFFVRPDRELCCAPLPCALHMHGSAIEDFTLSLQKQLSHAWGPGLEPGP